MAKSIQKEGWKVIKVRLHHNETDKDIETIEKIVEKTSGEIEILVDANQAQSSYRATGVIWDFDRAKKMNEAMSDLGCYWLEEPRPRYNYKELSKLVAMNKTKIARGENNPVVADFYQMIENNSYDVLQPESMVLGGITPLIEIGELSLKYNKEIVPHHGGGDIGVVAHTLLSSWENAPIL